jgi:hypothetical protein
MKKFFYIILVVSIALAGWIGYNEIQNHNHLSRLERAVESTEGAIADEGSGAVIIDVPVDEWTEFVHALADLGTAMTPLLAPVVVYGIAVRRREKGLDAGGQ